ncbi:hypothetical protein C8Q75DRAFT_311601 [Abortiporus biennis]|nr:hypothetical protein C8Q75DRAFT_311601 [Abortiporus biennis]
MLWQLSPQMLTLRQTLRVWFKARLWFTLVCIEQDAYAQATYTKMHSYGFRNTGRKEELSVSSMIDARHANKLHGQVSRLSRGGSFWLLRWETTSPCFITGYFRTNLVIDGSKLTPSLIFIFCLLPPCMIFIFALPLSLARCFIDVNVVPEINSITMYYYIYYSTRIFNCTLLDSPYLYNSRLKVP